MRILRPRHRLHAADGESAAAALPGLRAVASSTSAWPIASIGRTRSTAPVAIALARGNEDARLAVDRALSHIYATQGFREAYVKWFGEPDADTVTFFRLSALPD